MNLPDMIEARKRTEKPVKHVELNIELKNIFKGKKYF